MYQIPLCLYRFALQILINIEKVFDLDLEIIAQLSVKFHLKKIYSFLEIRNYAHTIIRNIYVGLQRPFSAPIKQK